jgi:putative restriction endonuclease
VNLQALRDPDWRIRLDAFAGLSKLTLEHGSILPWRCIEEGFEHQGRRYRFANQSKGIFRPAGMTGAALSIKTTVPRRGPPKYDDIAREGAFSYALQARNTEYHDNKLLLEAQALRTPVIYFYGVTPGFYRPVWPAFVVDFHPDSHSVQVVASDPEELYEPGTHFADDTMAQAIRRYTTVQVKKRLHQDLFRHIVLDAYQERCSVCRLPRRELLDAAHINPDADVRGEPVISNGLALCKLHHGAYDADLLGIRPDHVIEIASVLRDTHDGATLEHALKGYAGQKIHVPRRPGHRPDPLRLEWRYERFRKTA